MTKNDLLSLSNILASNEKKYLRPLTISHGDREIDPTTAARILTECHFDGQDARMKGSHLAILRHVENIKRGLWLDYSQITFCRVDDKFILVNGYHRLNAVIEADQAVPFNIVIIDCASMDEVKETYAKFDRVMMHRARSDQQALNSIDFSERLQVSKTAARALYRTLPIILNGMRMVRQDDEETRTKMGLFEVRTEMAFEWKRELQLYDEATANVGGLLKAKLWNSSITAVALQTFRYQQDHAWAFWKAVANNDGLRTGSPEHTLVFTLLNRSQVAKGNFPLLMPTLAWNAYFTGRPLSTLKPGSVVGKMRLAGTPVSIGED